MLLSVWSFLLILANMCLIVSASNDQMVAGYGTAISVWSFTVYYPVVAKAQGFFLVTSLALGDKLFFKLYELTAYIRIGGL